MNKRLLFSLILIFLSHGSIAQSKPDTAFVFSAVNEAQKTYTQRLGGHTHLHNGVEHKHYREEVESEAYLEPEWVDGSTFYDQQLFERVPLMYDMIAQRVVTYFFGQADIELITDKVDWFMINGRKFVYLERGKKEAEIDPGFYELLHDGTVKLYARRRKKIIEKVGERSVSYSVSGTNHFFLYKEDKYIPVNGRGALVAALRDKEKELKQFKKKNKISFNQDNKEMAIKQYVAHYNKLQ